ncbi:MAG: hypothetical protein HYZ96_00960 [Candidatus Omnitrophica bacterium]|nr:hypothetical protein [Candidatus Omnitrophota bacterium]
MTSASGRWQAAGGACVALVLSLNAAWAGVPRTIAYQGKLTETNGSPLAGDHVVTLRLYDAAAEGAKLWEEQHAISLTALDSGVFALVLGAKTPFGSGITFNEPLWLSIEVDGAGEFAPRQPLSSVGYALNADTLDGLDSTAFLASTGGIQPGDIEVGDLPAHASLHQPGGSDALLTAAPASVGSANSEGASTSLARADHIHQGVHSLAASGQPQLTGDVALAAGANVTLTQAGQDITIAASGGAAGNRATDFASNSVAISSSSDTSLISVTITKSQAGSALLVLATVQLNHTSGGNKTVDLKLFRDASQLDASYRGRVGTGGGQVEELPVTLQAWDTSGAGTYTFSLKAKASANGATATVRRLTAIELP